MADPIIRFRHVTKVFRRANGRGDLLARVRVQVPSKFPYRAAQAGDRLLLIAPSGGGYGPPGERDPAAIRDDIADGVLSLERARDLYGLEE